MHYLYLSLGMEAFQLLLNPGLHHFLTLIIKLQPCRPSLSGPNTWLTHGTDHGFMKNEEGVQTTTVSLLSSLWLLQGGMQCHNEAWLFLTAFLFFCCDSQVSVSIESCCFHFYTEAISYGDVQQVSFSLRKEISLLHIVQQWCSSTLECSCSFDICFN